MKTVSFRVLTGMALAGANFVIINSGLAAETDAIAKLGNEQITVAEIRPLFATLSPRDQQALSGDPALLEQFVRSVLAQKLLLKEALANKWDQQPEVTAALAKLRDTVVEESFLRSVSKVPDSYPSEEEVKSVYEREKAALLVPRQFRLAQIFVAAPKGASTVDLAKAQEKVSVITAKLKGAEVDFATIAKSYSDEQQSASRGGEIGWLTEAQIQPEVRAQLPNLAKAGVSSPIRLNDGWHVIKVLDVKEAYTPTLSEVRDVLVQQMRTAKQRANSEAYLAQLLQENDVAVNEIALSQLVSKTGK